MSALATDSGQSTSAAMKANKRWLIWQGITRPGKLKPDKVPYYAGGALRRATDTPDDTACLATYEEACEAISLRGEGWGLGFALGRDVLGGCWQGIDLDNTADHELSDLVDSLPGYVETSPSGKGVHAIGYGRHFRSLGSNGSGIEAYAAGRFFTFTGNAVRDAKIFCIADHVEKVLRLRHKPQAPTSSPATEATTSAYISAQSLTDLRSALNHLGSDDYSQWIEMGHALKSLGELGRGLWLDWSATSSKYHPQEAARKWDSFDPQRTGFRAVFARALLHGWTSTGSSAAVFGKFAV